MSKILSTQTCGFNLNKKQCRHTSTIKCFCEIRIPSPKQQQQQQSCESKKRIKAFNFVLIC